MMGALIKRSYNAPTPDRREIARYAGARLDDGLTASLIDECLSEALPLISYNAVYTVCSLSITDGICDIDGIRIESSALAKCLCGAKRAVIVAATVGLSLDRVIAKYSRTDRARALIMQAIGTERVEAVLDELSNELRENYGAIRPRFSVGYGDAPLSAQREITARLDTARLIGVSLSESLIMSPSKSVTAIIGLEE